MFSQFETQSEARILIENGKKLFKEGIKMKVKVAFTTPDIFLASAIRGLSNQIGGFETVTGQSNILMMLTDELVFGFNSQDKAEQFKTIVRKYIASEFQNGIQIELISN